MGAQLRLVRRVLAAAALVLSCGSLAMAAPAADDPVQQTMLKRALFADGRLWLLSDLGLLSSLREGEPRRRRETADPGVADICVQNGHLLALVARPNRWTLQRYDSGRWRPLDVVRPAKDVPLAMDCALGRVTVLTSHQLLEIGGSGHAVRLSGELGLGLVTSVLSSPDALWVGFNAGEWGGGLYRVDRRTGKVSSVEQVTSPVNGLAESPWRPGCIVAAIGLVHFMQSGELVQVCGASVETVYAHATAASAGARLSSETVAFFSLVRQGRTLWTGGTDGLHRLSAPGRGEVTPWPKFLPVDGVYISFDQPELILVLTEIYRRRSVSGAAPLLVAR